MSASNEHDVLVAGAGPVGSIAAIALAQAGLSVALVGPQPNAGDRRTTALMLPALEYLEKLGLPPFSRDETAPLEVMRIIDGTRRLIRSAPVTFRASEIGAAMFGTNIPNTVLLRMLKEAVEKEFRITRVGSLVSEWRLGDERASAILPSGETISASLAVAADGRMSPAREAAGITVARRDYPQTALVLNFGHSRDHGHVSTEFHTETGPCTQVPLPGNRSSLVWIVSPETAAELSALDDRSLSDRIEERIESILGKVEVEPGRQIYPMSALLPSTMASSRVALVGEAAHVFPPIGAQGMNLGIRDVADLVDTAVNHRDDPGSERALSAYRSARRLDVIARQTAVNSLNVTLLSDFLPAQVARSAGLGLLAAVSPLRGFVMREGMQPGSGFARIASGWRKQVRR
ncbi:UbiH/UbiF family hydroxylase [Mesorhizobium australicum]|uniref:2-octaprenyl-3-methyl-6-methoxy-1,4-benzoquinol hydroxylase n=1 Tax=Mesorhizobium australicum TaxID=536018 RepID=A0A1X7PCJ7_9HYPH|nr:UbiH/UbiF family hydroxylase [Mesorhizobium australicum]SMH47985.1 2-octaprenyl-3-methyl-6-methoxy-1,4-benzoquinol hydroxylase [Mesorhizobium australicum]